MYVLGCLVITGMVSQKELDVTEARAYVLEVVGQDKVAGVIAVVAVIGIMAVIFAYIYATTRVFFAMRRCLFTTSSAPAALQAVELGAARLIAKTHKTNHLQCSHLAD